MRETWDHKFLEDVARRIVSKLNQSLGLQMRK